MNSAVSRQLRAYHMGRMSGHDQIRDLFTKLVVVTKASKYSPEVNLTSV